MQTDVGLHLLVYVSKLGRQAFIDEDFAFQICIFR